MTAITTTQDYVTWNVNTGNHTEDEVRDYIAALNIYKDNDVRCIAVQTVDKVIQVNGIVYHAAVYPGGTEVFNKALGDYSEINGNRVKAIHYYADRDYVVVEYLSHPADPTPRNTFHTSSDFGTFFNDVFTTWKSSFAEMFEAIGTTV
jgi:hypothetical protein